MNKANSYFYTFSMIETIILAAISMWQVNYIKNLVRGDFGVKS